MLILSDFQLVCGLCCTVLMGAGLSLQFLFNLCPLAAAYLEAPVACLFNELDGDLFKVWLVELYLYVLEFSPYFLTCIS